MNKNTNRDMNTQKLKHTNIELNSHSYIHTYKKHTNTQRNKQTQKLQKCTQTYTQMHIKIIHTLRITHKHLHIHIHFLTNSH